MNEQEALIYSLRIKSRIEKIRDVKEQEAYEVLVAAADPNKSRREADAGFAEYLKLSGKEIADAMEDAMRQAFKEVSWVGDLKEINPDAIVASLLAAADPKHCMTDQQKAAYSQAVDEWLGNIEGSLEQIATDTFGTATSLGNIPVKISEWGINVPADIFDTTDIEAERIARTEEAVTRSLAMKEIKQIDSLVADHLEVWKNEVDFYQGIIDNPGDLTTVELDEFKGKLENAEQQAGITPFKNPSGASQEAYDYDTNGDFYWNEHNLAVTFETEFRLNEVDKVNVTAKKLADRLRAQDQKNLKDYSRLGEVFHWNQSGDRSYLLYEKAKKLRTVQAGRFKPITFTGIGVSDISGDVDALTSASKSITAAERAIAEGRIRRFLEQNIPEASPAKINKLLANKQFVSALGNSSIVGTEIRSSGVGLAPLHAGTLRNLTDRGVNYARLSRKGLALAFEDEVCKGLRDGLSPQEAFDKALEGQRDRLQRIGENTSNSVINDTMEEMAKDPFFSKVEKIWVTSFHNSRATHIAANGQRRPLKVPFTVGGELGQRPHDPSFSAVNLANCQCRMITTGIGSDGKEYQINFASDPIPETP